MFKINWKVRFSRENMTFIFRVFVAVMVPLLAYFGFEGKDITSWAILWDILVQAISNPWVVFFTVINFVNVLFDPTTSGLGDSAQALTYTVPKTTASDERKGYE